MDDLDPIIDDYGETLQASVNSVRGIGYEFTEYAPERERFYAEDEQGYEVHLDPHSTIFFSPNCLESQMSQGPIDIKGDRRLEFASKFIENPYVEASAHGSSYLLEIDMEHEFKDYPRGIEGLMKDADEVIRSLHVIHGESKPGIGEETRKALE